MNATSDISAPTTENGTVARGRLLSVGPPMMAALPSADSATEKPWSTNGPTAPVPTSLPPCWLRREGARIG
jgi:hypothetical protein